MVLVRAPCFVSRSQDRGNVFDLLHFCLHTSPDTGHLTFLPGLSSDYFLRGFLAIFQEIQSNLQPYDPFAIIEGTYMGWFTLEFITRLLTSPDKVLQSSSENYLICFDRSLNS